MTKENSGSSYFINNRKCTEKDVEELLKSKGVDIDNNRFLILQGEVEQIAMMKPKGTASDEGMLEYLEDIIGSNQYVPFIEADFLALEQLNEQRTRQLEVVKAAEEKLESLRVVYLVLFAWCIKRSEFSK